MSEHRIDILDKHSGDLVDAVLHDELSTLALVEAEKVWGPYRIEAVKRLIKAGTPPGKQPQHWHWDWSQKAARLALLAYRSMGIECQGHMQGLMLLRTVGDIARVGADTGKPIIYASYIETAPWNAKELEPTPRFGAIGVRLIEAAIRLSEAEGFMGRIGLHSLPQSEGFYRDVCRMHDCGKDAHVQNLRYFELDRNAAQAFLGGGTL